ncbi:MAG: hypothetical protein AAFU67_01675 [Bacteroidota bacterium]
MRQALTILKDDPRFADFPDFEELRRRGIEHIAKLSGDLWTDHNLHDPGITILEALCFALTDLGYRTSLDINELVAPSTDTTQENNFFTPEEILTANPLTILDYRKLLIDIQGVRNAWIIPAELSDEELAETPRLELDPFGRRQQEQLLYYPSPNDEQLSSVQLSTTPEGVNETKPLYLRGLYRVVLEVDPQLTQGEETNCGPGQTDLSSVLAEARRRLHAHRNLCEDFIEVSFLRDEEIGLCLEVDLSPKALPDDVLANIYSAVEEFISPKLSFYSLAEMLEKGEPIEKIYRGRPYLPAYFDSHDPEARLSHGFVDEEELTKAELPTVLRASDLYRVIMGVEGVRAIRELKLVNFLGGIAQTNGVDWELPLTLGHRPLFSPQKSVIKFYKGVLRVIADQAAVTDRFRQRLADYQKNKYPQSKLNLSIPYGNHREDLGDYYSIQQEFPTVYGIGPGDLPASATAERKAQALQLQGYLTFFDQLLANYLAQLAHIRELFAFEGASGRTYFGQTVESIPQVEKLLQFYQQETRNGTNLETLVQSTRAYDHPVLRDQAKEKLVLELRNLPLDELQRRLQVVEDNAGYYFVLLDGQEEAILRGVDTFTQLDNAEKAGQTAVLKLLFQGGVASNYRDENRPSSRYYSFSIVDDPSSYTTANSRIVR